MDSLFLTALAAVSSKLAKASGPLAPGEYIVDETVTIRVAGIVAKGENEQYTPTVDIPLLATLALFVDKIKGVVQENQIQSVMDTLTESMTAAITANVKADPTLKAAVKDVEKAMDRVRELTGSLPEKTRTGKTRVDATVVAVQTAPATVAIP